MIAKGWRQAIRLRNDPVWESASRERETPMIRSHIRSVALIGAMLTMSVSDAAAQSKPIQLSLVTPVQIVPEGEAVGGFRFNLIYGRNAAMTGLDIGLVNHTGPGDFVGVQFGILGLSDGGMTGWQANWVNITEAAMQGVQTGLFNLEGSGEGLQWGAANIADFHNGLQLAIVNYARTLHGIQIGIVNIIKEGGAFPVFPIANWSFD